MHELIVREGGAAPIADAHDRGAQAAPAAFVSRPRKLRPVELTTEVVTTVEGIRSLKPHYERLCRVTGNTLPFALQEWHLTWCAHFLNCNPQISEQPLFHVLRNSGAECVAIVPLIVAGRRIGPLRLNTVDFIGADPVLTEVRTPLIEPGYERLTVRAVHESLARRRDWDWIHWRGIGGTLAEAMSLEIAPRWYHVSQDYVLDMPSSWQEFRAGLKRNARESLRRCYNSLRRDGHSFDFVVARTPAEVDAAVERFLALHAMRAGMRGGPEHPNRFAGPRLQEFLRDVCGRLAARDAVRVFQLRIGSEIVASRIAFIVGDSVYLYYSGFDPAWARYSVMTTTLAETFQYAIANGLKTVNLSLTPEQSKLRWRPRLIEFRSALVYRENRPSGLAYRAYHAATHPQRGPVPARLLKGLLGARRSWN